MDNDPSVLIGAAMWNKIGDCENTYNELISIFKEVGKYTLKNQNGIFRFIDWCMIKDFDGQ